MRSPSLWEQTSVRASPTPLCPWHMLASVWSSSVLSPVRQCMTCSTCSYEAQ
ncbi:unnamed protein product [Symbiodinium sp. CCMP2456]|nr:unnamed protein product [Symbiodinium sp. CCMP2456]